MHEQNQATDTSPNRATDNIESAVGKYNVIRIEPVEKRRGAPPVVMVGGWSTDETAYLPSLEIIARDGYTCWSPGKIDKPKKVSAPDEFQKLPQVELQKAMAIIDLIEKQNLPKARLLCHSEGGLVGSIVALLRPDLIQDLVLLAPIGLNGADSLPELLKRFQQGIQLDQRSVHRTLHSKDGETTPMVHDSPDAVAENAYHASTPIAVQTLLDEGGPNMRRHILRNPINALREGLAMGKADIRPWLKEIRAHGIRVTLVTHIDDKPIPSERVQESIPKNWGEYISGYYSMTGQHGDIMLQPGVYGKAVQYIFHDLDNPINHAKH